MFLVDFLIFVFGAIYSSKNGQNGRIYIFRTFDPPTPLMSLTHILIRYSF